MECRALARVQSILGNPATPRTAEVVGRRYHFHSGGVAYAVTTVVLVIGAVNGQNNLLFWLFGLGVAGLLISGILSGGSLMQLAVERETPSTATVGEEVVVRYRLHNRSRLFPAYAITIEEISESKRGRGGWAGRLTPLMAFAPYIPPRSSVVVEARVRAVRRGLASMGPLRAWTTFPFGLTKKSVTFHHDDAVLVRPWMAPLRQGLVRGISGAGDLGSTSRRSRTGDEFYSLREFVHGDSLRSVAWRSTARLGHAVVREMASRPSRRVWVVLCLDVAGRDNEQIISVAAALVEQAIRAGFEPGLALGDGSVIDPARGGRRLERTLDQLASLGGPAGQATGPTLGSSAMADDGYLLVCSAGGGPEGIPGERILIEDSGIYAQGLPAGWHPSLDVKDTPKGGRWQRLIRAWKGVRA